MKLSLIALFIGLAAAARPQLGAVHSVAVLNNTQVYKKLLGQIQNRRQQRQITQLRLQCATGIKSPASKECKRLVSIMFRVMYQ